MSAKLIEEVERSVETACPPKARTMPSGAAVAALMAAMLGMLALAVVNVLTAASKPFNTWVHDVGKLWMPGAAGIGPYSGKETISLLVWLGAWVLLHYALRRREMRLSTWLVVFLAGVGVATTLIWPPVFEYLAGH
jgi:cytochrome c biogenesis factor